MLLSAPWWLLALLPWLGLTLYLLMGRSPRVAVPFVELWQDAELPRPRRARSLRPPPISLAAMLAALLLAIVAAARPAVITSSGGPPITIILDRGATMSGNISLEEVERVLRQRFGDGPVDLWPVPGDEAAPIVTDRSSWRGLATGQLAATALDTSALLPRAISAARERNDQPIVVATNQAIDISDGRVVRIPPRPSVPRNVGFVRVAARGEPVPAAMVTVRNDSELRQVRLCVTCGGRTIEQDLDLPPRGQQRDAFVELPSDAGDVIGFELLAEDDLPVDNRAWLLRRQQSPRIEAEPLLPPEIQRMIDVYARHRRPSEQAPRVIVTTEAQHVRQEPAAIIGTVGDTTTVSGAFRAEDHPITRGIQHWPNDAVLAAPPGDGWQPIVTAGDQVSVAVRESPARQVWVGFHSHSFARSPDFVIFWTNVLDWLGGGDEYASQPVQVLGNDWRRDPALSGRPLTAEPMTGVYTSATGDRLATCALDLSRQIAPETTDWLAKLAALPAPPGGTIALGSMLLIAGLLLLGVGVGAWGLRARKHPKAVDVPSPAVA
jgi:hypothetical protein